MLGKDTVGYGVIKWAAGVIFAAGCIYAASSNSITDLKKTVSDHEDRLRTHQALLSGQTTDIDVLKNDVSWIKRGVDELVSDKRRRRGE